MTQFIPMIRTASIFNQSLKEQLVKMFDGREKTSYQTDHSPISTSEKNKIVLIKFRLLPSMKRFRWGKKWWRKTSFKSGTKDGHEFEIPAEDLVGVYLKDLGKDNFHLLEKRNIKK